MNLPSSFPPPATARALLVLGGQLPSVTIVDALLALHPTVIAADGAADHLSSLGHAPDAIIGDLDSVADVSAFVDRGSLVIEEPDQEVSDFEKCLLWVEQQGFDAVTVLGLFGGMPDHAANNLSILTRFVRRLSIVAVDRSCVAYGVTAILEVDSRPGDRVSLIPLVPARVRTRGLAWELRDEMLAVGIREGASNHATHESFRVEVFSGVLMVFHYSEWMRSGTV